MCQVAALVLLACLSSSFADKLYEGDTSCDFGGLQLREELSRVLSRLAKVPESAPQELRPYMPGFEVTEFTVEGLDTITIHGPVFPYCVNGSRMLRADLISDGEIVFSLPWKACTGHEGVFKVSTSLFRFTAQFSVLESPGGGVKFELSRRVVPEATHGLRAFFDGVHPDLAQATRVLSMLFPRIIDELWYWQFTSEFDKRFRQASR